MRKISLILTLVLALTGALVLSARAANPILDFNISPPTSGVISYAGGASILKADTVATAISVDTVTGLNTPKNAGVPLAISGGRMFFETGPFTGLSPGEYDFSVGNGFVNIFGAILGGADTQLLSGFPLTSPPPPHVVITPTGGTVVMNFLDIKAPALLDFYGLTGVPTVGGSVNLSFATATPINPNAPTAFTSSTVLSGDVTNTFVPVPASVLLMGSGLLGLLGLRRLRKS